MVFVQQLDPLVQRPERIKNEILAEVCHGISSDAEVVQRICCENEQGRAA